MITVQFYQFSKKENSTARPDGLPTLDLQCEIKGPCSIVNPTLIVHDNKPFNSNYCFIPDFSRFYRVNDWEWMNGLWVANCSVDVLASWKDYIGGLTEYVTRCSSFIDGNIVDTLYPTTNKFDAVYAEGSGLLFKVSSGTFGEGYFILGVMGKGGGGSVVYYALTSGQLNSLVSFMYNSTEWYYENDQNKITGQFIAESEESGETVTTVNLGIDPSIVRLLFNPSQYILSCKWMPLGAEDLGFTTGTTVKLGYWDTGIGARLLNSVANSKTISFGIQPHPQSYRGDYLNHSPFSNYTLVIPGMGSVEVPSHIAATGTVNLKVSWDIMTGGMSAFIVGPQAGDIPVGSGNIGVDVPMSSFAVGKIVGLAAAAAGALNKFTALFAPGTEGLAEKQIVNALPPEVATVGSASGMATLYGAPIAWIYCVYQYVTERDVEHLGSPYCRRIQISSCSGYVLCRDPDFHAPCTDSETAQVNGYLTGGFYYE